MRVTMFALAALALAAGPALGHGWLTPPYDGPSGGGTATYQGPGGGGDFAPGPQAGTGGESSGGTTAAPLGGKSAAGGTGAVNRTGITGGTAYGSSAGARKPKSMSQPWLKLVRVPWSAAFAPTQAGYDSDAAALFHALTLSPEEGGLPRDADLGSIVLVYDPSDAAHAKALESLEANHTFKIGSHFFNCLKVDSRGLSNAPSDIVLSVHRKDGTAVGELKGGRDVRRAHKLLEVAYEADRGVALGKVLPKMDQLLSMSAAHTHYITTLEGGIVCPDCGHERHDVMERLKEFRIRNVDVGHAIDSLRAGD